MKLPNNLGLKAYLILFGIVALGNFFALITSDGTTYTYYNTLLRFNHATIIWYLLAVLDAILGCLTVIPLAARAFTKPRVYIQLFQVFFVLRVLMIFLGHNYEWVVIKSALIGTPLIGWITLGVYGLFLFPSFKEHYTYAFRK